jgi:hypothetical protein
LQARFPHYLVGAFATLRLAEYMDKKSSDSNLVRSLYQRVIDEFPEFDIYDPQTRWEYGTHTARNYLDNQ